MFGIEDEMDERKKEDRRIQRTRQILSQALMALIEQEGYERITVQNIIDKANLGRSTFYAHYRDKDDLLISSMDDMIHSLMLGVEPPVGGNISRGNLRIISIAPLFRHAQEQFRLHKAIMGGQGIEVIIRKLQKHLSRHLEEQLELLLPKGKSPSISVNLMAYHLASTVLTLLRYWLDNNRPHTPEQMDEIFQELTMPGILSVLL